MADTAEDFGLTTEWQNAAEGAHDMAARVANPPFRIGRIVRVERGECDVVTTDGRERVASDSLRSQDNLAPVTGDWVVVGETDTGAVIAAIVERQSTLARRDPSEEVIEQVLAANIDNAFLVHGLDRPLRAGRLERFLVLAWDSGAQPVVVLTKADVDEPGDGDQTGEPGGRHATELRGVIAAVAPDVPVCLTSSVSGQGLDTLDQWLTPGSTTALLGESGSGKSTLVNALLGHEEQETGAVRSGDAKGRHTTITRDLLRLESGALLVDTPGIRAVGLWDAEDALERVFGDIVDLADGCRFNDCSHGVEPGCAVRAAVEEGELDARRLDRFAIMAAELLEQAEKQKQRERKEEKRQNQRRKNR